jgi:hypothetical protein
MQPIVVGTVGGNILPLFFEKATCPGPTRVPFWPLLAVFGHTSGVGTLLSQTVITLRCPPRTPNSRALFRALGDRNEGRTSRGWLVRHVRKPPSHPAFGLSVPSTPDWRGMIWVARKEARNASSMRRVSRSCVRGESRPGAVSRPPPPCLGEPPHVSESTPSNAHASLTRHPGADKRGDSGSAS